MLEPDLHLLARREGSPRRREHIQVCPVDRCSRFAVHRPRKLLPVQTAGQQDLVKRFLTPIHQQVLALRVVPVLLRKQVQIERDMLDIGHLGIAIRGEVFSPVIFGLLLGRASFVTPAHQERKPDARHERNNRPRQEPEPVRQRSDRGRKRCSSRVASTSRRRANRSVIATKSAVRPSSQHPAQNDRPAIQLQGADVAALAPHSRAASCPPS